MRLLLLPELYGGRRVLARRSEQLPRLSRRSGRRWTICAASVAQVHGSDVEHAFDLAELRGYHYHSGVVFAAYARLGDAVALGGRYDEVGKAFGRARPATGFSMDLRACSVRAGAAAARRILAPYAQDAALQENRGVARAGRSGRGGSAGHEAQRDESNCDRVLVQREVSGK